MTQPRMYLPGTTYFVTHTVHNRLLLLRPSPEVNRIVQYCAARAATALKVELHWLSVQSNHVHLGITDHGTDLSRFMQAMDRAIARCLIDHYSQTHPHQHLDAVWARRSFSQVTLLTPEAVIEAMTYSLTNCVKDGQVRDYHKWPGVCSRPDDWAREVRYAERPGYFFDQQDDRWASVPYQYTVPPMLRDRPLPQLIEGVQALLRDRQRALRNERRASGRGFRGAKAVLNTDPFDSPNSKRSKGRRNPTLAAGGNTEMLRKGMRLLRAFRELYRDAWRSYRAGKRNALFPAGTLNMRVLHDVCCDVLEAPWCAAAMVPT